MTNEIDPHNTKFALRLSSLAGLVLAIGFVLSLSYRAKENEKRIRVLEARMDTVMEHIHKQTSFMERVEYKLGVIQYTLDRHKDIIDNSNVQRRRFQEQQ
jgi:hypothetical protein